MMDKQPIKDILTVSGFIRACIVGLAGCAVPTMADTLTDKVAYMRLESTGVTYFSANSVPNGGCPSSNVNFILRNAPDIRSQSAWLTGGLGVESGVTDPYGRNKAFRIYSEPNLVYTGISPSPQLLQSQYDVVRGDMSVWAKIADNSCAGVMLTLDGGSGLQNFTLTSAWQKLSVPNTQNNLKIKFSDTNFPYGSSVLLYAPSGEITAYDHFSEILDAKLNDTDVTVTYVASVSPLSNCSSQGEDNLPEVVRVEP